MDSDDRVQPGYDYWAAQVGQGQYENPRKNINGQWTDLKGYDTNIVTDQAIEFMRSSRSQPFCTWIGFKACHGPWTPAPGHEKDFANLPFQPPASFFVDDEGKPKRVRNKSQNPAQRAAVAATKKGRKQAQAGAPPSSLAAWSERERAYYRCLMGAEDNFGRIFAFLEQEKLMDDTIIFFSGDNGFFHGEHGLHGKMEPYEEALRVPMMVRYPRLIPAGQRCDAFVSNVDMAPSILDLCGIKAPKPMQGQSWRGLVTGKSAPRRDSFVYTMHAGNAAHPTLKALRTDRYKLVLNLNPGDKTELYDLKEDPKELKNIADKSRALLADLRGKLVTEMKKLEDPALPDVEAVKF
jgi:N-acetylglucosamine-6-sulfatase